MLRLTGAYADGWYPTALMSPAEYERKLGLVREAAQAAGRDPNLIVPSFQVTVYVGPSERAVRDQLESLPSRYSTLLSSADAWRALGLAHPLGDTFRGVIDIQPERIGEPVLREALAAVPKDFAAEVTIWGTPAQVTAKLQALADAGMRHVVLVLGSALVSRGDALYAIRALRGLAHSVTMPGAG